MWKHLLFFSAILLLTFCKSAPHQEEAGEAAAAEEIVKPGMSITSITILQADIVVTRMKISLRIDNANDFPVTLSSFRYELYGDGSFWADGMEKNLAVVQAKSSSEVTFEFDMNFINMKRQLLDDIIALRQVRYRVAGQVEVQAENIPSLSMNFDYSGNSEVKK